MSIDIIVGSFVSLCITQHTEHGFSLYGLVWTCDTVIYFQFSNIRGWANTCQSCGDTYIFSCVMINVRPCVCVCGVGGVGVCVGGGVGGWGCVWVGGWGGVWGGGGGHQIDMWNEYLNRCSVVISNVRYSCIWRFQFLTHHVDINCRVCTV